MSEYSREYYLANRARILARDKAYKAANREHVLEQKRQWGRAHSHKSYRGMYGISEADYAALLEAQGGKCAICGASKSVNRRTKRPLSIDHDHATGRIRGMLCQKCNMMLGMAEDQAARLRAAADYLERTPPHEIYCAPSRLRKLREWKERHRAKPATEPRLAASGGPTQGCLFLA